MKYWLKDDDSLHLYEGTPEEISQLIHLLGEDEKDEGDEEYE